MEYKTVKELYEKQTKNIGLLFDNYEFTNLVTQNELLKTNFFDQISVLNFLEKKLMDPDLIQAEINKAKKSKKTPDLIEVKNLDKASLYLKKFKELTSSSPTFNDYKDIKRISEIKDIIKYFDVYLNNTYKHDLKYYLENKPNVNQQQEAYKAQQVNQTPPPNQNTNTRSGFGAGFNPFANRMFTPNSNFSYESWKDQQILAAANMEMKKQIASGQFYLYDSKPKLFLLFKRILGGLLMLSSLVWVVTFVAQLVISSAQSDASGYLFYGKSGIADGGWSFGISNFFYFLIIIALIIYFLYLGYKYIFKAKTENELYSYDKRTAILIIFLIVIVAATFITELVNKFPNYNNVSVDLVYTESDVEYFNTETAVNAFYVYIWGTVAGLASFVLVFIFFCIAWIYAPKYDSERIQKKLEEIINQIRSSTDFSGPGANRPTY